MEQKERKEGYDEEIEESESDKRKEKKGTWRGVGRQCEGHGISCSPLMIQLPLYSPFSCGCMICIFSFVNFNSFFLQKDYSIRSLILKRIPCNLVIGYSNESRIIIEAMENIDKV